MADQFTLQVHPEQLRDAARKLKSLADHCETKGRDLSATPGQIGDEWTGDAADSVKGEMTALGSHVTNVGPKFRAAADALTRLAADYEEGQSQIAGMNAKWEAAQTAYDAAVATADRQRSEGLAAVRRRQDNQPVNRAIRDEFDQVRSRAVGDAHETRRTEERNLHQAYSLTKQWLSHRTKETGRAIDDTLVVKVTPEQVAEYQATSVPPLGLDRGALEDLVLANRKRDSEIAELVAQAGREASSDLAELERVLGDDPTKVADPAALEALLVRIGERADDDLYAEALTAQLGAQGLNELYNRIDASMNPLWGDTNRAPQDWARSLEKFNDVIANGLAQFNDADLLRFAGDVARYPDGSVPRVGMILGSEYADSRLKAIGLAWLDRMNNSRYEAQPGNGTPDTAERLLSERYGGFDAMVRAWTSGADADEVVRFLNNVDPNAAQEIAKGIIDTGWHNNDDGPLHQDTWKLKSELWVELLDSAVSSESTAAAQALLASIERGVDSPSDISGDFYRALADRLNDAAFVEFLAGNRTVLDQEVVARVVQLVHEDVKVDELVADLIRFNQGTSESNTARDVGYLLGLLDVAGTEVDFGSVLTAAFNAGLGKATSKVPGAGDALSVLQALLAAQQEADKKFDDFGEKWSREEQHQALAWAIYLSEHGEPPGFSQWHAENQNRYGSHNPEAAILLYLEHLSDAPQGSDEAAAWESMEGIFWRIRDSRDLGQG